MIMTNDMKIDFIETLGNPLEWDFTGDINDLGMPVGQCICGHNIRYEYVISNGSRFHTVGSTCIDHFKEANPSLYETLLQAKKDYEQKKKDLIKAEKEAMQNKEIIKLKEDLAVLMEDIHEIEREYNAAEEWIPSDIYYIIRQIKSPIKKYKKLGSYIKKYQEKINYINRFYSSGIYKNLKRFNLSIQHVTVEHYYTTERTNAQNTIIKLLADQDIKSKGWTTPDGNKVRVYVSKNRGYFEVNHSSNGCDLIEYFGNLDNAKTIIEEVKSIIKPDVKDYETEVAV